jgi:hypothetical protein
MAFIAAVGLALQDLPANPIIVKIIEPKHDPTGLVRLSEILIGSLGLTGALLLLAALLGAVTAGLMYWVRSRQS